jgi:integrase
MSDLATRPTIPAIGPADTIAANIAEYAVRAEGAFTPNTARAIKSDQKVFDAWCMQKGILPLSERKTAVPPETVAAFVKTMAEEKKPATIRRYVASIAHWHRAAKAANPCADTAVTLAMKAMHRTKGRAQKQAEPFARIHVDAALKARPRLSLRDLRQRAILAVAYDTLCRASELVALRVKDIKTEADGSATILVERSKTDQQGEGSDRYLHIDTIRHVRAWLCAADLVDGALFRAVLKGGRVGGPLHECEIGRAMRELAPKAAGHVSAHSTRVGAATDMVAKGIQMAAIMQAGGWKTETMVARYSRRLKAQSGGAAKLAKKQKRT